MAMPLASPTSNVMARLRGIAQSIARPVFAVVLAIIAGGIVIMITSPGTIFVRFNEAIAAYQSLFYGAFGNPQNLSFTLTTVTPLILASVSVALSFRAGLFNIGAAGQLAMGAMTAGIIGFEGAHLPGCDTHSSNADRQYSCRGDLGRHSWRFEGVARRT